ncbi:MAG: glycosyltransferase family 4 protein [Muribaculaceae bacterium]
MIIGFDGKRAVLNNTGLGNYSRLLIDVLATAYPGNEYRLYTPRIASNPRLMPLMMHENVRLIAPALPRQRALSGLWRLGPMGTQMVRDSVELIHGLSGELPLNVGKLGRPSVVTMHDVIFRRFPQTYAAIDRTIYDYKFRRAAAAATRILAISECTARDVMEFYGVPREKIDVVYQGCDAQFHRTPDAVEIAAVKERYSIERPYIIAVGSVEERKNQMLALRGLRGIDPDVDLVIVGRRTRYTDRLVAEAAATGVSDRVKFVENARFADLPALYAGALLSSYTSRYEGFGIPVIESLSVGTPVIVASGSCLEEAAGPDAPVVNPDNAEQWTDAAARIIASTDLRQTLADRGREYVARFSDRAMADGTMQCYQRAAENF